MYNRFELLSDIVYGPVPSRRLGRSLGINNIPPKYCTYSCVYCQLGRKKRMDIERRHFYDTSFIVKQAEKKITEARRRNEQIDYIAFVPDGEPALDIKIGESIRALKPAGIKIAVITNCSLLTDNSARKDISSADWVSLKMDAFSKDIWRAVNRPHKSLNLKSIHEAMLEFSSQFSGTLVTETMLIDGLNTDMGELKLIADFIQLLKPYKTYISIPVRPPAESFVRHPDESCMNEAYQIFAEKIARVECLASHEGNDFAHTGDIIDNILGITSVHPMREDSMRAYLSEAGAEWDVVQQLIRRNILSELEYNNYKFYMRKFGFRDKS